jgi:plastocyanin
MLRTVRRVIPLAIVLALFLQSDAFATVKNVSIVEFTFTPTPVKLTIGDSVVWTNTDPISHTATSNAPFSLWDSGTIIPGGGTFQFQFIAAGGFPYHCERHNWMTALIGAKGRAFPASGTAGTLFKITVATVAAPELFDYDIQWKVPGSTVWQDWMTNVLTKSVTFDSTGRPTGKYQFRSRMSRRDGTGDSSYSLPSAIRVT